MLTAPYFLSLAEVINCNIARLFFFLLSIRSIFQIHAMSQMCLGPSFDVENEQIHELLQKGSGERVTSSSFASPDILLFRLENIIAPKS